MNALQAKVTGDAVALLMATLDKDVRGVALLVADKSTEDLQHMVIFLAQYAAMVHPSESLRRQLSGVALKLA